MRLSAYLCVYSCVLLYINTYKNNYGYVQAFFMDTFFGDNTHALKFATKISDVMVILSDFKKWLEPRTFQFLPETTSVLKISISKSNIWENRSSMRLHQDIRYQCRYRKGYYYWTSFLYFYIPLPFREVDDQNFPQFRLLFV